MKYLKHLAFFILALTLSQACSTSMFDKGDDLVLIHGKVTDEDGSPIERIKVSFSCGTEDAFMSVYTSDNGEYNCITESFRFDDNAVVSVLFEDIDGVQNYGQFESENLPISAKDITVGENGFKTVTLDCRLIRATP